MKFLKSSKDAITFLLVALLVVSCFWIVKSELKAASLQSRLDEHHKQLQVNSDVLEGLVFFDRGTSKANIQLTEDIAYISSELASIKLKNNKVEIETPGDIQIGNGKDIRFGYRKDKDFFYMVHGGTILNFGKLVNNDGTLDYGVNIGTKSGNAFLVSDEGVGGWVNSDDGEYSLKLSSQKKFVELKKGNSKIRFEKDNINIEAKDNIKIKISDTIRFGYRKDKDFFYMVHGGTILNFGKLVNNDGTLDYGVNIGTKSGNAFLVSDEGVGGWVNSDDGEYSLKLAAKKKFVELKKGKSIIRFEGDDISIEAPGDINITSKNGKVNINGKR